MNLYTARVVAAWIGLTEHRVRQLRDEGVLQEKRPGLYDLQSSVTRYIAYLRRGSGKENLASERALLTRAKREAAELDNQIRRGTLHRSEDIETGIKTMCLNMRSRFLALPAKLAPAVAALDGSQNDIFDAIKRAVDEALEDLQHYDITFALHGDEAEEADDS